MSLLQAFFATLGGAGTSGGSGGVLLSDRFVQDSNGGTASVSYRLTNTGDIEWLSSIFGTQDIGDWISPKSGAPGSYEVRADLAPGSMALSSGTVGSWLALTSSRTWTVERSFVGVSESTIDVQIRLGGTVLTTARITLYAEAF
jgi:hypothetical protein